MDREEGGDRQREGMSFRYGYDGKTFNENLNPLYGQIRKAVGRKWDSFYSDLRKNFDMRSVINQHILQHLYQYIAKDVFMHNGELCVDRRYGGPKPLKESRYEFYVDPRTGYIRRNRFRKTYRQIQKQRDAEHAAEEAKVTRWIDPTTVLRKVNDTWFIYDVRPIPESLVKGETAWVFDVFLRKTVSRSKYFDVANTYHANCRTASRKLLKKLGLRC